MLLMDIGESDCWIVTKVKECKLKSHIKFIITCLDRMYDKRRKVLFMETIEPKIGMFQCIKLLLEEMA